MTVATLLTLTIVIFLHLNTPGDACVSCADVQHLDWPLLVGSLSAVLLFLCSVVLVVVLTHRKGISHMNLLFFTNIHSEMISVFF